MQKELVVYLRKPMNLASVSRANLRRAVQIAGLLSLFSGALLFQICDTAWLPLRAWDESRLAVNAIEMLMTGEHLVTTFDFSPDLWNTKPPLLINLMALSMQFFGATPFALRLPAALSAVFTVVLVTQFVRLTTRSLACGLFAGLVLLVLPLFYGWHGGQTGDYDAPLTLLTTGYGILLFGMIHSDQSQPRRAALTGALVGLAILIKGVAGLIPGLGIAVYALAFGRAQFFRKLPDYLLVVGVGLVIGLTFYALRSHGDPGYLSAVQINELGGRFSHSQDTHNFGPSYYLRALIGNPPDFRWQALLFPPALGLLWVPAGRVRQLGIFSIIQVGSLLLVFTAAATKLPWYIMPALPWLAIVVALGGHAIYRALLTAPFMSTDGPLSRAPSWLAGAAMVAIGCGAVGERYLHPGKSDLRAYGVLITEATKRAPTEPLLVVDGGYENVSGFVHYTPTLRFHRLAAQLAGVHVAEVNALSAAANATLIGSCDPALVTAVALSGAAIWQGSNCVLIHRKSIQTRDHTPQRSRLSPRRHASEFKSPVYVVRTFGTVGASF
jgi:4-amino-4-deoxy-L-arabinose transferase-like glycosyltransferase